MSPGKRFNSDKWFRRNVEERTRRALQEQERRFLSEHAGDTDEQLAALVKARARELRRSPQPVEVTGARYIEERFGSWQQALTAAGERMPTGPAKLSHSDRYRTEYRRQVVLFQTERSRLKAERAARNAARLARQEQPPRDPDAD